MALSDWTQITVGAPTVDINSASPIFGPGSLRLVSNGGDSTGGDLVTLTEDNYTKGLTRGRMRQLVRIEGLGDASTECGFFFMASALDVTTSGDCYSYSVRGTDPANYEMVLNYHDLGLGLDSAGGFSLFTGPVFSVTPGVTIVAMEVEWQVEPGLLNGIQIILRQGAGLLTDFTNLSEIGRVVVFQEEDEFIGLSNAEGVYMDGGLTGTQTYVIDRTSIIGLTPI